MSALIWVAIVAVWGFVLIPMWLRRHDTSSEQRATERFTVAMRVLSRRPSVHDEGVVDRPLDDHESLDRVGGTAMSHAESMDPPDPLTREESAPARPVATTGPRAARPLGARSAPDLRVERRDTARTGPRRRPGPERAAAMRVRRQRLTLLAALFPLTVILAAVLGGLWIGVQLLADLAIAGYVVHLRRSAQVERRLEITRAAIERRIEAERAARGRRRPAGSAFAYRGRDADGPADAEDDFTPEELAHAQAETIDLGVLMSTASTRSGDWSEPADDERWEPIYADGAGHPAAQVAEPGAGHAIGGGPAAVLPSRGAVDADQFYEAHQVVEAYQVVDADVALEVDVEVEMAVDTPEVAPARAAARPVNRPTGRPTTSRPGRVQINPPGTHGGLTAPPEAAPTSPAAGVEPAAAVPGEEIDPLLRRHAVGS
ncbi:gephyrin-like molybdotransferase receptor GlpR [Frankia sp. AgB32]|uniref:gephyrin-like molybdotransferase receptor GlpR n=1 Tax=Frankia sp. AgB32 TaxID=631119 RepID=UPI00200F111E|nr:gephyrin-like molybdotransferase receptor GlpR [Frankia sp. AgB32]MCK9893099.1 hypothetical protein [Frankia sp. AgB32]